MELAHDVFPWRPWAPGETAARLSDVGAPWGIAGGWALRLFVGEPWREHEDLEIAVPHDRFGDVRRALGGLELWVPSGEGCLRPLGGSPAPASHQTWALDRAAGAWRLDVLREPARAATWICRRDSAITLPLAALFERTKDGIPFVRPDVVLLFKARHLRAKDELDFDVVAPRLGRERSGWLRSALERAHPGHGWIDRL